MTPAEQEQAEELPVAAVVPEVVAALRAHRRVVLVAPPGSGKTTLVSPAILASSLIPADRQLVLLQPRRVAARAVARELARRAGCAVGQEVGFQVRFDRQVGPRTRLRVATEGILVAELQRDPELAHVGAVVLDEFHERSLQADLALSLLVEVQDALREDLLLVVMSATLDADPLARWLGCPVVQAHGRQYPLDIEYLARPDESPVEQQVARAVGRLDDAGGPGDVLCFLPGAREIHRTADRLTGRTEREVVPLYGRLSAAEQDRALRGGDRSRVVLATNIAETSLTIAGITAVVDSGRARVVRHDPGSGLDRLEDTRISRASADQRAGRAGRLGPGRVLRLWTRTDHATRPASEAPELQRVDLAGLVLELRAWGATSGDMASRFYDPPGASALEAAEQLLVLLGALDEAGGPLTPLGHLIRSVPAHPRVARMLLAARDRGQLAAAAWLAACLQEGLSRPLRSPGRAAHADVIEAARGAVAGGGGAERSVARLAAALARSLGERVTGSPRFDDAALCRCLLDGWPDRVCVRPTIAAPELVMVGGRGARLHRESVVQTDLLLLGLDVDRGRRGERSRAQVRSAAHVDLDWLLQSPLTVTGVELAWDPAAERVVAARHDRYLDLVVRSASVPLSDRESASALLQEHASRSLDRALTIDRRAAGLLARLRLIARVHPTTDLPVVGASGWPGTLLPQLCQGRSSFADLRRIDLGAALRDALTWAQRNVLERLAPERLAVPSGSEVRLDYGDGSEPPVLAAKVQELFGWLETPAVVDGRAPVVVHLLDPAGRPLQVTRDLHSFWTTTWREVRAEMRSRYPRHRWPEDPLTAEASRRTTQKRRR